MGKMGGRQDQTCHRENYDFGKAKNPTIGKNKMMTKKTKSKYRVIIVDPETGAVLHKEGPFSYREACKWVREWERRECDEVAVVWPVRAPPKCFHG